jgi:hypothetical protein
VAWFVTSEELAEYLHEDIIPSAQIYLAVNTLGWRSPTIYQLLKNACDNACDTNNGSMLPTFALQDSYTHSDVAGSNTRLAQQRLPSDQGHCDENVYT